MAREPVHGRGGSVRICPVPACHLHVCLALVGDPALGVRGPSWGQD